MGGYGSGRRWSSRDTTDDYRRIDVRWMERENCLHEHRSGNLHWSRHGQRTGSIDYRTESDRIILSYTCKVRRGESESLEYPVRLERTPCGFGGSRSWFLCPAKGCGKRVAVLYGGRIFACRRCYGLAYPSQRQTLSDRASDRAEGILKRLGWDGILTVFHSDPPRPKGMHERTYLRLATQYEVARYETFLYGPAGAMALYREG